MLTVVITDDALALVVSALVYRDSIDVMPLIWAAGLFAPAVGAAARARVAARPSYFVLGSAMWVVALQSGIEPPAVGLAFGSWRGPRPPRALGPRARGKALSRVPRTAHAEPQHVAGESIRTAISPD